MGNKESPIMKDKGLAFNEKRKQKIVQLVMAMDSQALSVLDGIISISLILEGDSVDNGAPCKIRKVIPLFEGNKYL